MVRIKLIKLPIKREISNYIGIPYWKNQWENGRLIKEGAFGGKGTYQEIQYATKCVAEKESLNLASLSQKDIYNLRKRNRIGVDCSGLTYHLLNKLDQINGGSGILLKVKGNNKYNGQLGVRYVSADDLTSSVNSIKLNSYDDIKTGDLIRMDQGKHVLFIVENTSHTITYIHSSDLTQTRGVHYGQIKIINPGKTLDHQEWSDKTLSGHNYSKLFYPQKGDGIYRLKCFA